MRTYLGKTPKEFREEKTLFRSVDPLSKSYSVQYCNFRRCASFIVLFHVGGTIYKRQHRGKYLYRRTVFRHVRNFGESPMASYFKYEMGYVAFARRSRNKRIRGRALVYVRRRVCMCVWNLSERWKISCSLECNWMNGVYRQIYHAHAAAPYRRTVYIIRRYIYIHTARGCILFRHGTYNFLRVQREKQEMAILHFSTFAYLIKTEWEFRETERLQQIDALRLLDLYHILITSSHGKAAITSQTWTCEALIWISYFCHSPRAIVRTTAIPVIARNSRAC